MRLGRASGCIVSHESAAHCARVTDLNGRVEVIVVTIAVEVAVAVAAGGAQTPKGPALTPGSVTRRTLAERYGNRGVVAIMFVSVGMIVDVDIDTVAVATTVVGVGEATLCWGRR